MKNIKGIFFTASFTLIIIAVFLLIEAALRITGAGTDTNPFLRHPFMKDFYFDNRDFRIKYYNRFVDLSKQPVKNMFYRIKRPGVLRGFVIGGSTAEGFPFYSNHSFSKILETALREQGIYRGVEVENLGFSAMSSYYDSDAAMKIFGYQPDFIIIYSGHNEYYGTVSATTGGTYFTKKIYLALKELRIFQLIFNFYSGLTRPGKPLNSTMMAEQFNNMTLEKNDAFDGRVTGNFIRNLDSVVRECTRRKIHIIVVEPACNLVDMPPLGSKFPAKGGGELSNFIRDYYNSVITGEKDKALRLYNERINSPQYNTSAEILYIDALFRDIYLHDMSLSNYSTARDYDTIPFRARSSLYSALSNYSMVSEHGNQYYHYVPLQEILVSKYGHHIMGNAIFLDHVHYNWNGNVMIAGILANELADIYHYSEKVRKTLASFFKNPDNVRNSMYFTPLNELLGYYSINELAGQPPFKTMMIPFIPVPPFGNPLLNDPSLIKMKEEDAFNKIINDSIERKDFTNAYFYISSIMQVYQAEYRNHLALARFQEMTGSSDAVYNYITAYILSGNSREVYADMEEYLDKAGRPDMLQIVKEKYGSPR